MQGYGVKIVGDDVMPDNAEWMFVKMKDGSLILLLAHSSAGCARVLSEAWAAYRCLEEREQPSIPRQREERVLRVTA